MQLGIESKQGSWMIGLKHFIVMIVLWIASFSCSQSMRKIYKREVKAGLSRTNLIKSQIISESDLQHLPPIVRKYLTYAGVIGKEKVVNVRIKFSGRIRFKPSNSWMTFTSEQYNFFDHPTRIFRIKSNKMGIPATGIHLYKNGIATMTIKIAGLFKVVDVKGPEMNQGETVTLFNDMCLMVPATLINKNIQWEPIDSLTVKAKYTNENITINATLFFNEKGELINFISNNRFESQEGNTFKNYPWSTPVKEYTYYLGRRIVSSASTIFHRPEIDFTYGEFVLKEIEYNCKTLR